MLIALVVELSKGKDVVTQSYADVALMNAVEVPEELISWFIWFRLIYN